MLPLHQSPRDSIVFDRVNTIVRISGFCCKPGRKAELALGFGFGPGRRSPILLGRVLLCPLKEHQSLSLGVVSGNQAGNGWPTGTSLPPHELFPWEYAVKRKPPPDPRHRYWMPEELFPSVVRSHRAVMRWRQPRSIHLCDEHGCVQLVDAGGETTRGRVPRGVSETFEVSPTGSIPRGKTRHGKSPMTRSKPLGPCYPAGTKHQRKNGH